MKQYKRFVINYLNIDCQLAVIMVIVGYLFPRIQLQVQLFSVPLFFAVLLAVMSLIRSIVIKKGKSLQLFLMIYRPVKIMLTLAFLLLYMFLFREALIQFVVVFAVFYLALLVYETRYFVKYEAKSE